MKNLFLSALCSVVLLQGAQAFACEGHAAKAAKCEGKSSQSCSAKGHSKQQITKTDKVVSSSASPKK
jgi:hypothetical protein